MNDRWQPGGSTSSDRSPAGRLGAGRLSGARRRSPLTRGRPRDHGSCLHAWSAALLLAAATAVACQGGSPTAPSQRFALAGVVSYGSQGLPSANVEVLSGPNAGQRGTTDAEGLYQLPALVAGDFSVRASATGYEPQTILVHLDRSMTVDFRLLRRSDPGNNDLVSVSGVVSDADGGTPIPGADVGVTVGLDAGRETATDIDGRFLLARLRPGAITIEVAAPGYRRVARELIAGPVDTLNVALERDFVVDPDRVSLSGTVSGVLTLGVDPAPIEGALVVLVNGPNDGRTARTDGDGQYRLDELELGPATLEVSAPEFETSMTGVTLDNSTTVDVVLARIEAAFTTRGRVVHVLSGAALADVTITGTGVAAAPSDAMGVFEIGAVSLSTAPRRVELVSPKAVPRRTYVRVPDVHTEISLVPVTFNLTAFDEMLRDPRLRRWRAAPPLVIERQTLQVSSVDAAEGTALDDRMSDGELQSLLTDLRWALPRLTGNTFRAFGGVTERVTDPANVSTLLTRGAITVVRVKGLAAATGTLGWARWLFERDGTVVGGVIMLDLEFDRSDSPYRRSLRAHELGHTLGYAHVSSAMSVMNPDARLEPTAFDRAATRIAFARQPGNLAPDVEPAPTTRPSSLGTATWSRPIR